jgi:hypothetical protein
MCEGHKPRLSGHVSAVGSAQNWCREIGWNARTVDCLHESSRLFFDTSGERPDAAPMKGSPARLLVTLTGVLLLGMLAAGVMLAALVRIPEPSRTAQVRGSLTARLPVAGASSTATAIRAAPSPAGTQGNLTPASATAEVLPSPPLPSPAPPPASQVRLTAPLAAVTIQVGTELVLDLTGTPPTPWSVRSDSDPTVLLPTTGVSIVATTLHAVFVGVRPGTATLEVYRTRLCVWAPAPDACPAQAFLIRVTVTAR